MASVFKVGDKVKFTTNHSLAGTTGMVIHIYPFYPLDDGRLYQVRLDTDKFLPVNAYESSLVPVANKSAYDGNKVVPWNTCHWKPRAVVVAAPYKTAKHVLTLAMIRCIAKRNNSHGN